MIVGLLNDVPGVKCQVPGGAFYVWPNVTDACRRIGVADSEDFQPNVSRETLKHRAVVATMNKAMVRRLLLELAAKAKGELKAEYTRLSENLIASLK